MGRPSRWIGCRSSGSTAIGMTEPGRSGLPAALAAEPTAVSSSALTQTTWSNWAHAATSYIFIAFASCCQNRRAAAEVVVSERRCGIRCIALCWSRTMVREVEVESARTYWAIDSWSACKASNDFLESTFRSISCIAATLSRAMRKGRPAARLRAKCHKSRPRERTIGTVWIDSQVVRNCSTLSIIALREKPTNAPHVQHWPDSGEHDGCVAWGRHRSGRE